MDEKSVPKLPTNVVNLFHDGLINGFKDNKLIFYSE